MVRNGGFYGWLYCYWGQTVDDRVPQDAALVATAITPDYALGRHTASLGLCWLSAGTLPGFLAPDGSLLVADDVGDLIWRVTGRGRVKGSARRHTGLSAISRSGRLCFDLCSQPWTGAPRSCLRAVWHLPHDKSLADVHGKPRDITYTLYKNNLDRQALAGL